MFDFIFHFFFFLVMTSSTNVSSLALPVLYCSSLVYYCKGLKYAFQFKKKKEEVIVVATINGQ